MSSSYPVEVLLNNRLEKEIQSVVYPFHLLLTLTLASKYHIQDNYITPSYKIFNVPKLFVMCYAFVVTSVRIFIDLTSPQNYNNSITTFFSCYIPITRASAFLISYVLNIINCQDNVKLVVIIQMIYKNIDFNNKIRNFILWNWILVVIAIVLCTTAFLNFSYLFRFFLWDSMYDILLISFEIEVLYYIRILILLTKFLNEWINSVTNMSEEQQNDKIYCKSMFETYQYILKAFDLFKNVTKVLVVHRVFNGFSRTLGFFEMLLVKADDEPISKQQVIYPLLSCLWIAKDVIFVIICSVYCEKFYIEVEEAKSACFQHLKNSCPDITEDLCIAVLQLDHLFSKMTACGLFCLDAKLPMHLMQLLTSYAIVLLQFAIL